MIEAFVGLVGGGKTFSSVRRMCNYMASGGVVVSNILLAGYDADSKTFSRDSPFISYLRDALKWEYQDGQYQYIPFDDMATLPGWFKRVPGGQSRDKRTFLCIDEATDLFDSLDRGKLNNDSVYRELFRFLRLSRHAHIDVLFICQDLNAINIRLRGLVGSIWRSTDMSNFRIGGLRIAIPMNCFLLQQFDRTGKLELRREFVAKDSRIFSCYESEAFHDDLGITFSGTVNDGRIRSKKKMTFVERLVLYLSLCCMVFLLFSQCRMRKEFDRRLTLYGSASENSNNGNQQSTNDASEKAAEKKAVFSLFSSSESKDSLPVDKPTRSIVRGVFEYSESPRERWCYVDGCLYRVGMLTEYGLCRVVSRHCIICVDGLHETVILPRASESGASAASLQGVPASLAAPF